MPDDRIKKLYHTISEVAALTGLDAHVLRYWEIEFADLRPRKNRSGHRSYTDDDIRTLRTIQRLLRDDKYTIEGARQRLHAMRADAPPALPSPAPDSAHRARLADLRAFLAGVLETLPPTPLAEPPRPTPRPDA